MTNYNKQLIEMVKQCGQELIDRAEEFVGESELITDFDIWIYFPQGEEPQVPTIECTKSVVARNAYPYLCADVRQRGEQDE